MYIPLGRRAAKHNNNNNNFSNFSHIHVPTSAEQPQNTSTTKTIIANPHLSREATISYLSQTNQPLQNGSLWYERMARQSGAKSLPGRRCQATCPTPTPTPGMRRQLIICSAPTHYMGKPWQLIMIPPSNHQSEEKPLLKGRLMGVVSFYSF